MRAQAMENHPRIVGSEPPDIEELLARLEEAEEAIRAIRAGEVDALVVGGPGSERVYTVEGADLVYRHLFEQMSEGAVVLDAGGVILFGNGRVGQMLAKPMREVLGSSLAEHAVPGDQDILDSLLDRGKRGISQVDIHLIKSDGALIPVHLSMAPFESEEIGSSCLILTDLSSRFLIEAELRQARETAESDNRAKGRFLAHMSHEIRTPMNAVLGMTELTLATELHPEQRENLNIVQSAGLSLLSIIDDILDFSKIEAGKLPLQSTEFEPREQLHAALDLLAVQADAKGLDLACKVHADVPIRVIGDPTRLRQVVINLVGNAIKFTESGHVLVEVDTESDTEGEIVLRFAVTDTGIGIAAGKQETIFEPFVQADASITRAYGGTGLGLTITSRIVAMMGGRIWVESSVGAGSTFRFTSRFSPPSGPRMSHPVIPNQLRGLRVLVATASPLRRGVLAEFLEGWGLEPLLADNGRDAVDVLERARREGRPFPLVVLDARMLGPDGIIVAGRIRDEAGLAGGVILMASRSDRQAVNGLVRNLGAAAILCGPISQAELLAAILNATSSVPPPMGRLPEPPPVHRDGLENGRPLRILIVDDIDINQLVISRMLAGRGHKIVLASDGKEALDMVLGDHFDLVLMDLQMPVMDGFQATAAIRAAELATGRHVPIIAITAHAIKGYHDRCLEAGMDGYLTKPIQQDRLWSEIATCVGTARTDAAS